MRAIGYLLTACCLVLSATAARDEWGQRTVSEDIGIDQHLNEQLPLDLEFKDEQGRTVKLGDYFHDKPVILTCVYFRCPMLCTEVLNGVLKSSQAIPLQLSKDYTILSVSIDPRETPEMAAAKQDTYARSYRRPGGKEGWHFLTGNQKSIDALTKAVGFRYRYDPDSDQYAHASGITLVTPQGRIARYFYGIDYVPGDLRLALVETSQNKIGTVVDQVLLMCFHYDPATGRYGFAVSAALRLSALALVTLGGVYLARMFMRERRRLHEMVAAPLTRTM